MRPLLLKGHERPLTYLKYNQEGDILCSCAKDHHPTLWYSDTGERLGTYEGHNGAVYTCDFTYDSSRLITASADTTVKLWDTETGQVDYTFNFDQPARACAFSFGSREAVLTTDPFMGAPSLIRIVKIEDEPAAQTSREVLTIEYPTGTTRITRAQWGMLNHTIVTSGEDGVIRLWDTETGKMLEESEEHKKGIQDIQMSADLTHFVSSSLDKTAKLFDAQTLQCLKTYTLDRPVNAGAISPLMNHVFLGGGQDAMSVTTTHSKSGKFESLIYHKVYEDEVGRIKGHFGPVNTIACHPDGRSFASGGEEGYIRIHHMDQDYFKLGQEEATA